MFLHATEAPKMMEIAERLYTPYCHREASEEAVSYDQAVKLDIGAGLLHPLKHPISKDSAHVMR